MPKKTPQAETTQPITEQPSVQLSQPEVSNAPSEGFEGAAQPPAHPYPTPVVVAPSAPTISLNEIQDHGPTEPIMTTRVPTPQEAKGIRADEARQNYINQLRQNAARQPESHVPPPLSARQKTRRELELEAGRNSLAAHKAMSRAERRPRAEIEREGTTTPVPRDGNKVPGFNEGKTGARTVREG